MLASVKIQKIWIARHKVDFRKGHDGLLGEAYTLGLDSFSGNAIVFIGRDRRRVKVLHADENGLWVSYKRFNKGAMKNNFKFMSDPLCNKITMAELSMLLEGSSFTIHKRMPQWPKDS